MEKSVNRVFVTGHLHDGFQRLARVIKSPTIISHIRFQTSGKKDECHAHPFVLPFLANEWIFAHNGKAPLVESYATGRERLEADSDSARAFEYLRDHLLLYYRGGPMTYTLFEAIARATARLLKEYPGEYNYLLTNGTLLFAFTNHRHFMMLKDSLQLENALLLTTIAEGLSPEPWQSLGAVSEFAGLLLLIAGGELIMKRPVQAAPPGTDFHDSLRHPGM